VHLARLGGLPDGLIDGEGLGGESYLLVNIGCGLGEV